MLSLRLPAKQHPLVKQVLQHNSTKLNELIAGVGSPLHLIFPQIFEENIVKFKRVIKQFYPDTSIFYAKKANKSKTFVEICAKQKIGVDVSSVGEFQKTLAAGVIGTRIGISGAGKSANLLRMGVLHDSLIAIDDLNELNCLIDIAETENKKVNILLRICCDSISRFGFTTDEVDEILLRIKDSNNLILLGFSFHLNGYSITQRIESICNLISQCQKAKSNGFSKCQTINIGGGLPISYIEPNTWEIFKKELSSKNFHSEKNFPSFYPYGSKLSGADSLQALFQNKVNNLEIREILLRNNIKLIIEPGRSLLDQCGISIFKVVTVKKLRDYYVTTVLGNSFHLSEQWFNSEYLPDPILISDTTSTSPILSCIAGATCLESDMLSWRKILFEKKPEPNDLIIYINTAGYQMDSNESSFHEIKIPYKIAIKVPDYNFDELSCPSDIEWILDEVNF